MIFSYHQFNKTLITVVALTLQSQNSGIAKYFRTTGTSGFCQPFSSTLNLNNSIIFDYTRIPTRITATCGYMIHSKVVKSTKEFQTLYLTPCLLVRSIKQIPGSGY